MTGIISPPKKKNRKSRMCSIYDWEKSYMYIEFHMAPKVLENGCHINLSADLLQLISLLKQCCQILWHKLKQFTIDILTILQGMMNIIRMSVKSNHIIITKYCQYSPSLHMVFKNRVQLYIRKGMMHLN